MVPELQVRSLDWSHGPQLVRMCLSNRVSNVFCFTEDTNELVETARRIQKERREEQMKRDFIARQKARDNNEEWKPEIPSYLQQHSPRAVTASTNISCASVPSTPASRASFASVQSVRTKSLLVKIRTDVSKLCNYYQEEIYFLEYDTEVPEFSNMIAYKV